VAEGWIAIPPPDSTTFITFWVPIHPQPKKRPRATIRKRKGETPKATVWNPWENVIHEKEVRQAFARAAISSPVGLSLPHEGPVTVAAVFMIPHPTTKPRTDPLYGGDLDNYIKLVLDALNRVAYNDDTQVIGVHAEKVFADTAGSKIRVNFLQRQSSPGAGNPPVLPEPKKESDGPLP
jgi:Holliday junction resolvase RusA-like endonuclease